MEKVYHTNKKRQAVLVGVFSLLLLFTGINSFGQTPDDLTDNGTEVRVDRNGELYYDFLIPESTTATFVKVRLDGGDGGRRPSCDQGGRGGKGANIYATFPVGDDDNMLKPGGTIRMVIGQKGANANDDAGGGGGGGGGTGLLYLSPDATGVDDAEFPELDISSANSAWILLAVAGGGGGGFGVPESVGFGNCESATAKNGTGGNDATNGTGGGGNNTGGVNGNGGASGGNQDGGAGGGYLSNGGPIETSKGVLGGISGGTGGIAINGFPGGAGYGGGGAGLQGGGGGGGFSGGGGGNDGNASANNGGGGGSWLNAIAIEGSIIILQGATTNSPDDGFISYSFPRLNITGDIQKLDDIELVQDFIIPTDLDTDVFNAITFTARGGDGGRARSQELNPNTGRGGEGALISADFEIGDAPQQLQPGGTLRFIVGKKGNSITFDNRSGAGGGGGTAVLYKPPGVEGNGDCIVFGPNNETQAAPSLDINDDCWSILLVAGGGGGGYHTGEGDNNTGRNGLDANTGINGTTNSNDGDGAPGFNGGSGESPPGNSGATVRSGGGGGYLPLFPAGSTVPHPAQGTPGVFTGGAGGTNDNNFINGGFGYGGGGSGRINRSTGLHGGGGGGGFSGGGGGRSDPGGGGGSFVNAAALLSNIEEAPSSKTSFQGCLSYELYFNPVTGPNASCNSIITVAIDGTGEYELNADIVNAGSTNENGGTNGLTLKLCKNIGNDLICGFSNFSYHCGNIGSTDEGLLQVSDGTEESYCAFTVEVVQGDIGTLVCPDPITIELEDCETVVEELIHPIAGTSCSDVYSYQLTLPDGTLDESPIVFEDDGGGLLENFSMLGVHNLSYTASFEDAEGEIQSQTCFTTITVVNAPAELFSACPNDRDIEIDKEDWDCSIPVGSVDGPDPYPANLELNYDGCGDVSWQVTSPGIDPIITTGTGLLDGFEFTPGTSTVTYFVDIPGAETATCSFTIRLFPETNNRSQLNDNEPNIQCLGGGNNDIVIADGMTDQEIFDLVVTSYSDDCEIIDFDINGLNDNCAFVGDGQFMIVNVWDAVGFTSCEVSITVLDDFGLTCPENIVVDTEPGVCEATIAAGQLSPLTNYLCVDQQVVTISEVDEFGTATEIASGAVISSSYTFDAGISYLIDYTATNDDGDMSDCSFTVTVSDTESPMAICQNVSVDTEDDPATIAAEIGAASTDNCGIASYSIDLDFSCENVQYSPITTELTVADAAGNASTCITLVELKDKTAPEFTVCPDFTVGGSTNQNACNFTLEDFTLNSFIQDGIEDDCGQVFTLSQFPAPGTLIEEESVAVTLEVLDEFGNLSTSPCVFTVEREDQESPELNCRETYTATLGTGGELVVDIDDLVLDITDNCTAEPFLSFHPFNSQTEKTYNCSDIGTFDRRIFADDETGENSIFCDVSITVQDPGMTAACQNATVTLDMDGNGSVDINQIDNGSESVCATISLSFDVNVEETVLNYTCMDLGPNDVVLYVTDADDNTTNCTATVTVVDESEITATCQNATVNLDDNGMGTLNILDVDEGSSTTCTAATLSFDEASIVTTIDYSCADIGETMITLYASIPDSGLDPSSCTATVTIVDEVAPIANCQSAFVYPNENGEATLLASSLNDTNNNSSDACGPLHFSFDENGLVTSLDFDCDDIGNSMMTLYVSDDSGNSSSCEALVYIDDQMVPDAVCSPGFTIGLSESPLLVSQVDGGSTDNCTAPEDLSIDIFLQVDDTGDPSQDFAVFGSSYDLTCTDLGDLLVYLAVTDEEGEGASCQTTIQVVDDIPPMAMCQNVTVNIEDDLETITAADIDNGSSDNCGAVSLSLDRTEFGCADVEQMIDVTLSVDDGTTISTCVGVVTVVDNEAPFVDCQSGIVNLNADGNGTLQASDLNDNNGSDDACGPLHFSFDEEGLITSLDFTCDDLGVLDDFVYVTDANGNTSEGCPVNIFVRDEIAPVALCQDVEVLLNDQGAGSINAAQFDNGSTDACGTLMFSFDAQGFQTLIDGFTCDDIGTIATLVYITDAEGNQSSCTPNIELKDGMPPNPVCQDVEVVLDENGTGSITTPQVDNGSMDNCGPVSFSFDENISLTTRQFDCEDGLSQVVTLYVTDPSGNTASCISTVSIIDDQAPVVSCPAVYSFFLSVDGPNILLPTDFANVQDNCLENVSLSFDQAGILTEILYDCEAITLTLADAHPVTAYATDTGGNTHSCTTNVRVVGGPQLTCVNPEPTVYLSAPDIAISDIAMIDPGSDPCYPDEDLTLCVIKLGVPGAPWLCEDFTMTCDDVGEDLLYMARATNPDGQSSSCISFITVINDLEVEAICQDVDLQLDTDGTATVSVTDVDDGTTDACSPLTFSFAADAELSTLSFTCDETGDHPATLYVWDEEGNTSTCTSTITITDDEKPVLFCNDIDVIAELAPGACDVFVALTVPDVIDNCDEVELVWRYRQTDEFGNNLLPWSPWLPSEIPSSIFAEGYYKIQWRATDLSQNRRRCLTCLTVTDPDGLPCPWANNHVDCDASSTYDYNAETFTLNSDNCHNSVTNNEDEYAYVSQTICGNAEIIAQVTNITGTSFGWAGVIMRESNDPQAKSVALMTNLSANHRREARVTTGGVVLSQLMPSFGRHWLRIQRIGNQFRAYASFDGNTWFLRFAQTILMDDCITVGLVLNGYTASSDVAATFANVSITGVGPAPSEGGDSSEINPLQSTSGFDVYPNPSDGIFNVNLVDFLDTEVALEVLNVNGNLVRRINEGVLEESLHKVDLSQQPSGIYLVRLRLQDGTVQVKRIVLQH